MRGIQSPSCVGQELSLEVQRDIGCGEREERLLNNRARCTARADDVPQGVDNEEALRLNLRAIDRCSEPFCDPLSLECVSDGVASLKVD